ncbi:hypothetical protein KJ657_03900 [Patescibacteria group bacterium]|nr:hypothetical protein [Patescibacteria group bacterium]MBU1016208.1 hypothetical protein [Patescibacteria group bacterium]MBU1684675.1 hypothetical protein [Patescibacteria group bacterium]MBU1938926.1 hypothetical protein [Patescibacteria group bacterium]
MILCLLGAFARFWSMWIFYVPAMLVGLYVLYCAYAISKSVRRKGWRATMDEIDETLDRLDKEAVDKLK